MWNTKERQKICHLCFEALIYGVRMSHRRVVVLLREEVHILDLKTMKRLHVMDRSPSPWLDPSVAALCHDSNRGYLALPMGLAGGHPAATFAAGPNASAVTAPSTTAQGDVARAEVKIGLVSMVDTYTLQPVGVLLAHRSPVQALALSPTGHMLATASSKASVIRVFSVPAFETLCVFRRGSNPCRIFGLNFSRNSQFLSAAAASGTVHIFRNSDQMLANALPAHVMPSPGTAPETKGRLCISA
jgi:autophagy-related protein 18